MKIITRAKAIERGLPRFFTGKPCCHGHVAECYVSSRRCLVCEERRTVKRKAERKKRREAKRRELRKRWGREIITWKEALARGLIHYFTGKPCCRGHVAKRWTANNNCDECKKADHKRHMKSPIGRETQKRANQGPLGRERKRRYRTSPKGHERQRKDNHLYYHEHGGKEKIAKHKSSDEFRRRRRELRLEQACDFTRDDYSAARMNRALIRWRSYGY